MTEQELYNQYKKKLKPQLKSLEVKRITIQLLYYLAVLIFITMVWVMSNGVMPFILALFILVFSEAFTIVFANQRLKRYRDAYKRQVVSKIVSLVNRGFGYSHEQHISLKTFNESRIFSQKAAYVMGDDFVKGKVKETQFAFSELRAWSRTREVKQPNILAVLVRYLFSLRSIQYLDQNRKNGGLLFKGLFFYADFNKLLSESTFVLPDTAEKLLGKGGQLLQRSGFHGQLVKLENPLFEKQFAVFSSSQQEARYVLTPHMMEAILNIKRKYKKKMYLSFTGTNVYIAIQFGKGLFEPRIHSSGVRFSDMEQMYDMFQLIETIITEMNLNTRIWTKG